MIKANLIALSAMALVCVPMAVIFAIKLWGDWQDGNDPCQDSEHANTGCHQAGSNQSYSLPQEPHNQRWHPTEQHHRSKERRYWWIQSVTGSITCVAAIFALCAAGASAYFAFGALKASRQQVVVARETEVAGLSAYVGIADLGTDHLVTSPTTGIYEIWIMWENFGSTPTHDLVITTSPPIRDPNPIPNLDFSTRVKNPTRGLLSPHQQVESASIAVTDLDMMLIAAGKVHVYFWGVAEYNDVFTNTPRHITRFCREILRAVQMPGDKVQVLTRTCEPQGDCADKECRDQDAAQTPHDTPAAP